MSDPVPRASAARPRDATRQHGGPELHLAGAPGRSGSRLTGHLAGRRTRRRGELPLTPLAPGGAAPLRQASDPAGAGGAGEEHSPPGWPRSWPDAGSLRLGDARPATPTPRPWETPAPSHRHAGAAMPAALAVAAASWVVMAVDLLAAPVPARFALTFAMILFGPGLALRPALPRGSRLERFALVIAVSLSVGIVVNLVLALARVLSATSSLGAMAAVTTVAALSVARRARGAGA